MTDRLTITTSARRAVDTINAQIIAVEGAWLECRVSTATGPTPVWISRRGRVQWTRPEGCYPG